jgi:hypothetical protein
MRTAVMRKDFIFLLRSTRSTALGNDNLIDTPSILKRLHWPMIALFLIVFSFSPALAEDYELTWKANEEPHVEGYKIYFSVDLPGPPYDGLHPVYPHSDSPIDVGNVTEYTLHDLEEGVVYYFAVTAYDSEGNESGYSNQVSTADIDNPDEFRSVWTDKDNPDISRSAWSDNSETEATGCFIQSAK